jgi:hypothetical protein
LQSLAIRRRRRTSLSRAELKFTVSRFNAVRYTDQFPRLDIGAQVIAAYNDCPSTGCRIKIAASQNLTFATPILLNTNAKSSTSSAPANTRSGNV